MLKMKTKNIKSFTLLEIIVAVALFTTITLSVLGIFAKITQVQYEIYDMQSLQNNAQYLIEVLSKEARMAQADDDGTCTGTSGSVFFSQTLAGGDSVLKFLNYKGECINYEFSKSDKKIYKNIDGSGQISMVSSDIEIESAEFIHFDNITAGIQPITTFRFVLVNPNYEDESKKIKIQSTISARAYP